MANSPDTQDFNPAFGSKFNQFIGAVKAQGGNPQVTSGYRSYQDQERLYNSPNGGIPVAKPGTSLHEKGMAADVTGDAKTQGLMRQLAPQYGLAFPFANDPVHLQLADAQANANAAATGATATGASDAAAPAGPMPIVDRLMYISQALGLPATNPAIAAPNTQMVSTPDTTTVSAPSTAQVASPITNAAPTTDTNASPSDVVPAAPGTTTAALQASGSEAAPASQYAALFNTTGQKYGISPALLSAMAKQESGFDPNARSGTGAIGLMQFEPGTAAGLGIDPTNAYQAVDGAARLMAGYLKQYNGDVGKALAAYNAGPGAVKKYGGIPPYKETQDYVNSIMATVKSSGGTD